MSYILVFKVFGEQSLKMLVHYFTNKNVRYLNNKLLVRNLIFDRNTYFKRYTNKVLKMYLVTIKSVNDLKNDSIKT